MSARDGGPAYPIVTPDMPVEGSPGLSLRDYFAAAALTGLIASDDDGAGDRIAEVPEYAYAIADAMLRERER